jgi:transposase
VPASIASESERRGPVLEVLNELLSEGRAEEVRALVAKLLARNSELERRLGQMLSRGKKSNEGISSAQLLLLLDELKAEPALAAADEKLRVVSAIDGSRFEVPAVVEAPHPPPLRRPIPAEVRRVENPIPVPEPERKCPRCGRERQCIGHDVTEVIDLVPAELIVRRDLREKLACANCEGELVRAPLGDKVVPGGRMGIRLVAQLLVDKYRDGLPLHRQKQRFEEMGLALPVSTLADQVEWATDLLRPLWRAAMAEVLTAEVMHLDGTSLPVLDRSSPQGIRLGALWGYVGRNGPKETALYLYASTGKKQGQREGEIGPAEMLALRKGYAVADASTIFESSFRREGIVECGCNMHARRYFTKALDGGDARAALPLAAFKNLYEVEAAVRDADAGEKHARRQSHSKFVYQELIAWCRTHRPQEPPASPLGRAINYLLNNEIALTRFLDDGLVPIDNGIVERLHVRAALTRKNYLFAGSDTGGHRAAVAYTILGSCQLAEIDPLEYLGEVMSRLSQRVRLLEIPALLPANWKAARANVPAKASAALA